jgi:hypothetical protein
MPVRTSKNWPKGGRRLVRRSITKQYRPCLKHATVQHDDVPVNHRHAKALFLCFGSFGVRVGEDREQREVGAQTEQHKALHTRGERLAVLQKRCQSFSDEPEQEGKQCEYGVVKMVPAQRDRTGGTYLAV